MTKNTIALKSIDIYESTASGLTKVDTDITLISYDCYGAAI